MKKIFLIVFFCVFYTIEGQAQRILSDLKRYDLKEVELRAIRRAKQKLRLPKELSVGAIHYFVVTFSEHMRKGQLALFSFSLSMPLHCFRIRVLL